MKKYVKPEVELVKFTSEEITDIASGSDGSSDNIFGEDDFS